MRAIESKPLHQMGTLIAIWAKFRGPRGRALKADRSLFDPIVKLKMDCPKIHEYLHVS
jgi:hypothetical protein